MITEEQMEALVGDEFTKRPKRESFFDFLMRVAQKARILAATQDEGQAAVIEELRALRQLLDERPALNSGLIDAYHSWTAKVYAQSIGAKLPGETLQ